ncbi:hypothetical protein J2S43_001438 [Catenuloplanes nepalensis]|uniref:AbrB/MazE/SpoVT family DNA-binding domain-containing protein n=1 Tax=Catenuloplanes nepalensis TaxID=587533 RepID=A0ABT9MNB5_9ACTN|nr:hypothetical protein [Catenuloplanes nepalensis]MDP9792926.1 hypothetical protein [Catenuloplanes nepalensis]
MSRQPDQQPWDASVGDLLRAATNQPRGSSLTIGDGIPLPRPELGRVSGAFEYAMTTLDSAGRLADRSPLIALGWLPGTRLKISVHHHVLIVEADSAGTAAVTARCRLQLPASVRHRCRLSSGDRVLTAAWPDHGLLVLYPKPTLDALLLEYHGRHAAEEAS